MQVQVVQVSGPGGRIKTANNGPHRTVHSTGERLPRGALLTKVLKYPVTGTGGMGCYALGSTPTRDYKIGQDDIVVVKTGDLEIARPEDMRGYPAWMSLPGDARVFAVYNRNTNTVIDCTGALSSWSSRADEDHRLRARIWEIFYEHGVRGIPEEFLAVRSQLG